MYLLVSFSLNFILFFIIIFFRSEIGRGIKLKLLTRFFDFCIVRIYTKDKRIKNYIIHADKEINEFKIEERGIYTIDPEQAYFEGSIPVYIYAEDNFKPLNVFDLKASLTSDPLLVDKVVLRAKASGRLAEWFRQQKLMLILIAVGGVMALISAFFGFKLYKFFEPFLSTTIDKVIAQYCVNNVATNTPAIIV